eukprot:TRINITY_DN8030_c0_g1_i1.p4 TRINITY_DN8030_c0_g1~~TRINITY_DN8030_c0_g1_i1.p4  ORF type:complete len:125 (-),score=12.77 TRINITY_DN8030_c0_g1_i1:74-448(-)
MPTVAADKTNGGVDFVPWVEKYRPKILDDVYGHQQNIATLRNQMRLGILPHMLFHGPPGTGKTSTIIAVANELYGEKRPAHDRLRPGAAGARVRNPRGQLDACRGGARGRVAPQERREKEEKQK